MSPKAKGQSDPRVKQLIDYAHDTYKKKFGVKMLISAADGKQVKIALGAHDLVKLKQYWDFFLNYGGDDWRIMGATKDLKSFCSVINRIVQMKAKSKPRDPEPEPERKAQNYHARQAGLDRQVDEYIGQIPPETLEERLQQIQTDLIRSHPYAGTWEPETLRDTAKGILRDKCAEYLQQSHRR